MKEKMTALFLFVTAAASAGPAFSEPVPNDREWGSRPANGEVSRITPAPFVWPDQKNAAVYELEYSGDGGASWETVKNIPWNAYCPPKILTKGDWQWRVRVQYKDGTVSDWSKIRKFSIAENAAVNPKPSTAELSARIPAEHPRIFLRPEQLPELRKNAKTLLKPQYDQMIETCENLLKNPPSTAEPPLYGTAKRPSLAWRKIWWGNRMYLLKTLGGAAELGFAWRVTGDRRYGEAARKILMECAKWDPNGSTQMRYNDECGMPYLSRFSRTYSFVHDLLTEAEREKCRKIVRIRGNEAFRMLCPRHLYKDPYNSHKNRMWHFLGEAAVVFHGEIPEAQKWLDFAMDVYFCVYPVWGDDDGSWHEGISYWREYLDRFFWWGDILHNTFGIEITAKPFFSRTGYFAMYMMPPGTRSGGFGDLAQLERNKHALTMKSLASLSGNPYWQWYADKIGPAQKEVSYIEFLRAFRKKTEPKEPRDLPDSILFRGNGLAILNSNLLDGTKNTQIQFKSSPTGGTVSHGYDANNSFLLSRNGERLLIRSGKRDMYASNFHKNWMWETKSENNILTDGTGQKKMSRSAHGKILEFRTSKEADYVSGEAADSYEGRLKTFRRRILFLKPSVILIADTLEAPREVTFNWLMHASRPMDLRSQRDIRVHSGKEHCRVEFLHPSGLKLSQTGKFDPEPMADLKLREYHFRADTPVKSKKMTFLTLIRPYSDGEKSAETEAVITENKTEFQIHVNGWTIRIDKIAGTVSYDKK